MVDVSGQNTLHAVKDVAASLQASDFTYEVRASSDALESPDFSHSHI